MFDVHMTYDCMPKFHIFSDYYICIYTQYNMLLVVLSYMHSRIFWDRMYLIIDCRNIGICAIHAYNKPVSRHSAYVQHTTTSRLQWNLPVLRSHSFDATCKWEAESVEAWSGSNRSNGSRREDTEDTEDTPSKRRNCLTCECNWCDWWKWCNWSAKCTKDTKAEEKATARCDVVRTWWDWDCILQVKVQGDTGGNRRDHPGRSHRHRPRIDPSVDWWSVANLGR